MPEPRAQGPGWVRYDHQAFVKDMKREGVAAEGGEQDARNNKRTRAKKETIPDESLPRV